MTLRFEPLYTFSNKPDPYFVLDLLEPAGECNNRANPNRTVKRFIVPSTPEQDKIPFARVNHNKYMVTERAAYIGTSNWSADYFIDTGGVAFVFESAPSLHADLNVTRDVRRDLQEVFERDWNSPYAVPLWNKL
ncbi:Phospholipase D3 [Operophtera brumata]|uniref:Phospholipase D3 n=1 Tax=Operophtera brumata TaxID=104452 RepID=A0A0L7LRG0_OPEBR|nr:Phospholipase D3 [Operophtera brumata]